MIKILKLNYNINVLAGLVTNYSQYCTQCRHLLQHTVSMILVSTGTHSNILFQRLAGHLLELLLDLNHVNFTPRHHHPHQCIVVSAHPLHRLLELVRKVGCLVPHTSD